MRSSIAALILLASFGFSCHSSHQSPPAGLVPLQLDLGRVYTGATKQFSLDFTFDGTALTGATFTIEGMPLNFGRLEIIQETPLGGGNWLLVRSFARTGSYEMSLRISSSRGEWLVPVTIDVYDFPLCRPVEECHTATFDPEQELCVVTVHRDGTPCRVETSSCLRQSACEQGVCIDHDIEDRPPACAQEPAGEVLSPAWTYQSSAERIFFTGTTDDEGNIYFFECTRNNLTNLQDCDTVSLDATGQERWRATKSHLAVQPLSFPHIAVVDGLLLVTMIDGSRGISVLRVFDANTGVVLKSSNGWRGTTSLVRAFDHVIATSDGSDLQGWDLDSGQDYVLTAEVRRFFDAAMISDGAGRIFGHATPFEPDPEEIPPLSLVSWNFVDGTNWQQTGSSSSGSSVLATFEHRLLRTDPDVRTTDTGELVAKIDRTDRLYDAVLQAGTDALAVADRGIPHCHERLLQKFSTGTGLLDWRCQLTTPPEGSPGLSQLISLEGGGAIVAVAPPNQQTQNAELVAVDGSGRMILRRPLPLLLDFSNSPTTTMAGSRWIVSGKQRSTFVPIITAFDVPGLRPATTGWITSGGTLSRDGTPRNP